MIRKRAGRLAVVLLASGSLVLTACSSGGGKTPGDNEKAKEPEKKFKTSAVTVGTAEESQAKFQDPKGAKQGGTVNVLVRDGFSHLDPGQQYVSNLLTVSKLISRRLTMIKEFPDGSQKLVGDLATDPGQSSEGGKVWTFKLKDNIKYEDGTPIKAEDFKYAVQRTYEDRITEGPTFLPVWLSGNDYRKIYKDKGWKKTGLPDSLIETPDDKTVIFKFKEPHSDANFATALPIGSPVAKDKDTGRKYDTNPVSSGPYKITEHKPNKSLVMERNTEWEAETDPIRGQYVDTYKFEFGLQNAQSDQRLIAASGDDTNSLTISNGLDPANVDKVLNDPSLKDRTLSGPGPYSEAFYINNTRVKDVKVRRALALAFPKADALLADGGPTAGDPSTTLMSPTVQGYEKHNVLGMKPNGDPAAAKKLLAEAGKENQKIVYAFANTAIGQKRAEVVAEGLEKAGFDVVKKPISDGTYYDEIGMVDNKFDLYWAGWGADWPTGTTMLPPVYDGRQIQDGAPNYAHFNDEAVNKEMDRILKMSDPDEAGKAWAALDKEILDKHVPVIPYAYSKRVMLYGPGLGNVKMNDSMCTELINVFVK